MKALLQFILRSVAAFFSAGIVWPVSFFAFHQSFLLASFYALLGGGVVYFSLKQIEHFQHLRKNGLTRREYKFIEENLKEAKQKIVRLRKSMTSVRGISHIKQNFNMIRTVQKIYSNTKKEPRRFYQAERFFYSHLDSLVELTEKYAFLSSQPAKTKELSRSLRETREMISQINEAIEEDLRAMLVDDVDTLHFELDVAKQSVNRLKDTERRSSSERA
ncbi:protein xpaC [Pueribacillus theae]|uniref:Protein xpaC n=1 Tax=Pueribacillus theae TaxID=2171751 RepID=A0A2U1K3D5_9BACI|nr:5-bromo-4-chloroindolyl phosphate hydrolysis family protein [Pueribacillus theae]PWA12021.1 protein xpaC [Pueribacillus theae]